MSRLLSNSAAEYTENRAGPLLLNHVSETGQLALSPVDEPQSNGPAFVSALDSFVEKDQVPNLDECYHASREKMQQLRARLEDLIVQMRRKKAITSKLGPDNKLPDLNDWNMDYMLQVTDLLVRPRSDSSNDKLHDCKNFVRRCMGTMVKKKDMLGGLMTMIPSYGQAIGAGVTLVLAVVEEHESLRNRIQTALADIPKKLNNIQRLSEVHIESIPLHIQKDRVWMQIFLVLHCILDSLSRSKKYKIRDMWKGTEPDIEKALEDMDAAIADYQIEVNIAAEQRIGRVEERGRRLSHTVNGLVDSFDDFATTAAPSLINVERKVEELLQRSPNNVSMSQEKMEAILYNVIYRLIASSPEFNPIDGTVNREMMNLVLSRRIRPAITQPDEIGRRLLPRRTSSLLSENERILEKWLAGCPTNFDPTSAAPVAENLAQMGSFDANEQDQIQYLMNAASLASWLRNAHSCSLVIDAETAPQSLLNPISATSAMLVMLLEGSSSSKPVKDPHNHPWAILSFFGGDKIGSGPVDLLNCLLGQLFQFILRERMKIDLASVLRKKKYRSRQAREDPRRGLRLLQKILAMLPEGQVVVLILDSCSRISKDTKQADEIIRALCENTRNMSNVTIKLLVTDTLANCPIHKLADLTVHLPDHVDGWQSGVSRELIEKQTKASIERFRRLNARSAVDSSEESDGDGEDEDAESN